MKGQFKFGTNASKTEIHQVERQFIELQYDVAPAIISHHSRNVLKTGKHWSKCVNPRRCVLNGIMKIHKLIKA